MASPQIGELSKFVKVRAWQDVPTNDSSIEQVYDAGTNAWARIVPVGAALFYGTQQVESTITHRLATWRTTGINADVIGGNHVVDHAGMRYRVRRATDLDGARAFVVLDLEQLGAIPQ